MKVMKGEDIPLFVQEVVDLGIEICAIGHRRYCLDDGDLPEDVQLAVQHDLRRVVSNYGDRAHLKFEINAYLRSIDRYWTKTATTSGVNPIRGWADLTLPICFNDHAPRAMLILAPWMVVVGATRPNYVRRPPP